MSTISPLVCGSVTVTWHQDDSVDTITYEGESLGKAVNDRLQQLQLGPVGIILPQPLTDLIDSLLNSVAVLSSSETRRKIFLADRIFEHLVIEMVPPNPSVQSMFWRAILDRVWLWEDSHEKVHKGTAYYFMAKSYLGSGDVASAYISFFNALEDDKRNFPNIPKNLKDAPAYLTTSLSCNPKNALFLSVVVPLRTMLQNFIDRYNSQMRRDLTLLTLDQKFLQADPLEDIKRFFVATFHEIYHLDPLNSTRMINNDYSKLKLIDTLFNLGLIVDQLLEHKFLSSAHKNEKKMANALYSLALHQGWTTSTQSKDMQQFLGKINPNLNADEPDRVVPLLLDGSASFDSCTLNPSMRAVFIAYHLRNFAGHHVEGQDVLVHRFKEVLENVMYAFLLAVEVL